MTIDRSATRRVEAPIILLHPAGPLLTCLGLMLGLATSALGCATPVEQPRLPVTWKTEIGPLLASQCSSCHKGNLAPGQYRTTSYIEVLEGGSDAVENAIAGDASSRLLTVLEGEHLAYLGDGAAATERKETIRRWIVDDALAYFWSAAHPPEILNHDAEAFHGAVAEAEGWTLSSCRSCHGEDYRGGVVGVACTTCHQDTPAACDTCHGSEGSPAPPRTVYTGHAAGAHRTHLDVPSGRFEPIACESCHLVPGALNDPGHVDNADGAAELTFGGKAIMGGMNPSFDHETETCSDTYCHGSRSGAASPAPTWDGSGTFAGCDGCHGFPPTQTPDGSPHPPITTCVYCHPATVDSDGKIADPSLHLDGAIELRAGLPACDGCHSGPAAPTPFHDPFGETDPTLPSVGAHEIHVGANPFHTDAAGVYGYACSNCHDVPATIGEPTHIDGDFTAELNFGDVATTGGAMPTYDPATRTCSDVWCHGAKLDGGGNNPTPVWTDPSARLVCGSCHGLPPAQIVSRGGPPLAHPTATTCETCHQQVIDQAFNFVDRSKHIDGIVEVGP